MVIYRYSFADTSKWSYTDIPGLYWVSTVVAPMAFYSEKTESKSPYKKAEPFSTMDSLYLGGNLSQPLH